MNILIYGAGAVGLGLASCLIETGHHVVLVARPESVEALNKHGLKRTGLFGEVHAEPHQFAAVSFLADVPDKAFDFILVCTKSFDTESAAKDLASIPFIQNAKTPVVLCQNGWGNADVFVRHFPKPRIKNARVITGFARPEPWHVEITVHADTMHVGTLFGEPVTDLLPLSQAVNEGGIPCAVASAIGKDLWAKLLYNCMLNGLSTLFNVPYGHLGESEHTRRLMNDIAREVFRVMRAEGYATHWDTLEGYLDTFYKHQLLATYGHISSMLQDLRAGKRTEVDALNGAVMDLGHKHGILVPYNTAVHHMIRFAESRQK